MSDKTTEFKIEKGIPIAPAKSRTGLTATLRKLEIGDSFHAPVIAQAGLSSLAKRIGITVASRRDGEGGVRIWRIK
jgi:ribosomal protein L13E